MLGVLGGMGPQATIDFCQKVLSNTKASCDQEHIHIITDSRPQIPDRVQAILYNGESPVKAMQSSLNTLIHAGAFVIAMPCVSAHYFLPMLNVPETAVFLNMPEIAAGVCRSLFPGKTAGVLCTEGTAKSGIVASALAKEGVSAIYPEDSDQILLGRLIREVKAGYDMNEITARFAWVADRLYAKGAEYFLLACTELPLIAQAYAFPYDCVDFTAELAKASVKMCGYNTVFNLE